MIRIKYHAPGTPPATLEKPDGDGGRPSEISLIQYDEESIFEGRFDTFEELMARYDPAKINWINIDGLGSADLLRKLSERFSIHPLALEDVLNTTQRPKVERYAEQYFIISEMIYPEKDRRIAVEQLSMFLGEAYVITLQEECGHDVFEAVRARLRSGRGYARKMKADYLAYALLDATVDQFFPILETVGDSIEDIEEELLRKPTKETLKKLYEGKRLLMQLRRAAWPQREIFSTLMRDDTGIVSPETQVFLRDCYDHTTQIIDILESFRDLAAGLMDVYLSSLGFRTNEIMRILTVFSVFFMPLTFIAGVYGMNFDPDVSPFNMPELKWYYGYPLCLLAMVLVATGMLIFFKRKHWL
jgi:magnesium transporter